MTTEPRLCSRCGGKPICVVWISTPLGGGPGDEERLCWDCAPRTTPEEFMNGKATNQIRAAEGFAAAAGDTQPWRKILTDLCPLCGGGAPHDEAACAEKMRTWKPVGILGSLPPHLHDNAALGGLGFAVAYPLIAAMLAEGSARNASMSTEPGPTCRTDGASGA